MLLSAQCPSKNHTQTSRTQHTGPFGPLNKTTTTHLPRITHRQHQPHSPHTLCAADIITSLTPRNTDLVKVTVA